LKPEDILAYLGNYSCFFPRIATIAGVVAFASKVAAHGTVTGIVADGV